MNISPQEQSFYNKIQFLASIPPSTPYHTTHFTNDDLYQVCQYIQPNMLQKDRSNLLKTISQYRDQRSGDTCLHIAGKASNSRLVQFLAENNLVDPNAVNNKQQNALTSILINNKQPKSDKIAYVLAKYTDLTARDNHMKRAYEVPQARMDPMRARLLEHLRNMSLGI